MLSISTARYEQATGKFTIWAAPDDGGTERCLYECSGYAGRGAGRNNPARQHIVNEGPLPCGLYAVRSPHRHPRLGPVVFRLDRIIADPSPSFGRKGFYIHGDSQDGDASRGCIVLARVHREAVAFYRVRTLEVVPDSPLKAGTRTKAKP